jgi:hypothetical protein
MNRHSFRFSFNRKAAVTCVTRLLNSSVLSVELECFCDVTGANTAGTGLDSQDAAIVFYGSDLLQVGIPNGTGFVVGMAYVVTEAGAFSTDIAFS